jgi:hypothetical protein
MKKFTWLLMIGVSMCSCAHVYYTPNTANAPLLSEKGETRINALYVAGGYSEFTGGEIQIAHAVSKNVGIMVNGFSAGTSDEVANWDFNGSTHTEKGNGSYLELAGGLFKSMDPDKKWIGEVYGGFGFGSSKHDYGFGDNSKVNIKKLFVQPSIGYKGTYFEAVIVPKISFVNWNVKESRLMDSHTNLEKENVDAIARNPSFITFEPALILRGGGKDFKIQGGLSFSSKGMSSRNELEMTESLVASIGISFNIRPKKK